MSDLLQKRVRILLKHEDFKDKTGTVIQTLVSEKLDYVVINLDTPVTHNGTQKYTWNIPARHVVQIEESPLLEWIDNRLRHIDNEDIE